MQIYELVHVGGLANKCVELALDLFVHNSYTTPQLLQSGEKKIFEPPPILYICPLTKK